MEVACAASVERQPLHRCYDQITKLRKTDSTVWFVVVTNNFVHDWRTNDRLSETKFDQ